MSMRLTRGGFIELAKMVDRIKARLDNGVESVLAYELRRPLVPGYGVAVVDAKNAVLDEVVDLCCASNPAFDKDRFMDYVEKLEKERKGKASARQRAAKDQDKQGLGKGAQE